MNDRGWQRWALWLLGLQGVFVVALAAASSRPIPFEFSRPMKAALALWAAGFAFLAIRTGVQAMKSESPLRHFHERLVAERMVMVRALQVAAIIGFAIAIHGWGKSMIPHVAGYWADPTLARLDANIFGEDPWRLFRSELLGSLYSLLYVWWFPITFGTMGVLAFSQRGHGRLFLAYLLTLILGGTIGQYLLPSAGPMFYEGLGFGQRFHELVATNDPTFTRFANYLWFHYQRGGADLGTGISAMPSMHIALAVWTTCAARAIWRPLTLPFATYATLLWAASIASGWHYATDGIAGASIAVGCYYLAGRLLQPNRETPTMLANETA